MPGGGGHIAVKADDIDDFQAVPLANLKVGNIVARGDFQGPGAELRFNGRIADDGNGPLHNRQHCLPAHIGGIAGILGMHRHAAVAEH